MSVRRYVAKRIGFACVSVVVVLTALFFVFAFVEIRDPGFVPSGTPPGAPSDGSTPLLTRYTDWMVQYLTLQWGTFSGGDAGAVLGSETFPPTIRGLVGQRLLYTATYALPGLCGAAVFGLVVGFDGATRSGTLTDQLTRVAVYVAFGLPAVVAGVIALRVGLRDAQLLYPAVPTGEFPPWQPYNLVRMIVPAIVASVTFVGATMRHARSESRGRLRSETIRLVRAKGGGYLTVARHVVRLTTAQLVSAFVAETLGLFLLVSIMIEVVFQIDGFGRLLLFAAIEQQPAIVSAVTFVTALVGIGGNLLADVLRVVIDPRVVE